MEEMGKALALKPCLAARSSAARRARSCSSLTYWKQLHVRVLIPSTNHCQAFSALSVGKGMTAIKRHPLQPVEGAGTGRYRHTRYSQFTSLHHCFRWFWMLQKPQAMMHASLNCGLQDYCRNATQRLHQKCNQSLCTTLSAERWSSLIPESP